MSLLNEWRKWDSGDFPYVLDTDADVLESSSWKPGTAKYRGWRKATGDPDFCKSEDKRLHLGLIPVPFMGDMLNASIYVLMLNPGLGPGDYFEYKVPRNSDGNPDSPQVVVFSATIVDVTVGS